MESKKLEALLMAVDLGSFTKAAEVMGYTHMMNSLEREVGFTLLERGRGGVRLTKDGERVAPAIREFLQANARLDSTIAQVASSRSEVIRVSAFASMAMHWLPSIIRRFREERPDVDVDIRMADHIRSPYELLAQGKMDVIFVSHQEEESGYEWIHLRDDTMYAVLPKDYPIDGRTGYPLSEFDGRDFIMPAQGFDKDIMRIFNRVGVKPHILPTAVDDPTVISMVEHGLGVSMMTELTLRGRGVRAVQHAVHGGGVAAQQGGERDGRELGMAVRAGEGRQASLQQFLECAQTVLAELEPK